VGIHAVTVPPADGRRASSHGITWRSPSGGSSHVALGTTFAPMMIGALLDRGGPPEARAPARRDELVTAALVVASVLIALSPEDGTGLAATVAGILLAPALALPVLWWRRAPLVAAAAFPAGVLVSALPTLDQTRCGVAIPIAMLILLSVGTREALGPALAGLALVMVGMLLLRATDPLLSDSSSLFVLPLAAAAWLVGRLVRSHAALAEELAARTARLEERRAGVAALAAQVERGRLAAILDEDVRRRVGTILALSGADHGTESFATIEREARAALDRMREVLGALRSDGTG
jgi:hypothetical protein